MAGEKAPRARDRRNKIYFHNGRHLRILPGITRDFVKLGEKGSTESRARKMEHQGAYGMAV